MSDTTEFSALEEAVDEQHADTSILHENKAIDIVDIARGNVICNEEQTFLGFSALLTGWLYPHERNVNTCATGASASGKSVMQEVIIDTLPQSTMYRATDASDKGVLDDSTWDEGLCAPLDEWQKIPDEVTELMKSLAGGADDKYIYVRSKGNGQGEKRSGRRIVKKAKPFQFLYAQNAMDHELSTRLVYLPVDENSQIRDAIRKKESGWRNISMPGYDNEYIYDTSERQQALRQHIRTIDTQMDEDGHARGTHYVRNPPWVDAVCEPIFADRTESNRVFGQVYNLIRSNAGVLNYDNRGTVEKVVDDETVDAYLTHPQDVANVLSARRTLLATTHELTDLKLSILDCLRGYQGLGSDDDDEAGGRGVTVNTIRNYLEEQTDKAAPRKQKLRDILEELDEQFYIDIHERATSDNAHLYQFVSMRSVGVPRVANLEQHLPDERIEESHELHEQAGYDIDLSNPFEDCVDPFRDQPFIETVEEMRQEFSQNAAERAASSADITAQLTDSDDTNSDDGTSASDEQGLSAFDMVDDADESDDSSDETETDITELTYADVYDGDVSETPFDNIVQERVYEKMQTNIDGETVAQHVADEVLVGAVDAGTVVASADLSGTIFDPTHDLWDQPHKPDEWVATRDDTAAKIEQAIRALERKSLVFYTDADGSEGNQVVHVLDVE